MSKTTFPVFNHQTLRILSDPQKLHEVVASAHAAPSDGSARTLWRLDSTRSGMVLYTTSPNPLDPKKFQQELGGVTEIRPYDIPSEVVEKGSQVKFVLKANPAVNITTSEGKPVRRVARTRAERIQWLSEVGSRGGFTFDDADVEASDDPASSRTVVRRSEDKGGEHVLECVVFRGKLRITDTDAFLSTLYAGVGKGKAFGCGLITLSR